MSTPSPNTAPGASPPDPADMDHRYGLVVTAAEQILPLFEGPGLTLNQAQHATMAALKSYFPEYHADYVNAARIIAFSMAALAALRLAAGNDASVAEKLRLYGRANSLNRSADQAERRIVERQGHWRANQPPDADGHTPPPDPLPADAEIDAAVAQAVAEFRAAQTRTQAAKPAPKADPAGPARTPEFAEGIRYSGPLPGSGPGVTASHKQSLLQRSGLSRFVGESGADAEWKA